MANIIDFLCICTFLIFQNFFRFFVFLDQFLTDFDEFFFQTHIIDYPGSESGVRIEKYLNLTEISPIYREKNLYQIFKALALKVLSDDKDKNYVIRYKDSESVEIIEKYQKITMGRAFYKIDKIVR